MKTLGLTTLLLLALCPFHNSQAQTATRDSISVQSVLHRSIEKARMALTRYGETDSGMIAIQMILADVAALPNIKSMGHMKPLHGSTNMSRALLASEGDSGICLYLSWFGKSAATPVHNHLTWGVIRVLQGKDRYTRWALATDSAGAEDRVAKQNEQTLGPGGSTYWLGPPNDIHTQQAGDDELWELVIVGRDLASDYVTRNQKRFDEKTGRLLIK